MFVKQYSNGEWCLVNENHKGQLQDNGNTKVDNTE